MLLGRVPQNLQGATNQKNRLKGGFRLESNPTLQSAQKSVTDDLGLISSARSKRIDYDGGLDVSPIAKGEGRVTEMAAELHLRKELGASPPEIDLMA